MQKLNRACSHELTSTWPVLQGARVKPNYIQQMFKQEPPVQAQKPAAPSGLPTRSRTMDLLNASSRSVQH